MSISHRSHAPLSSDAGQRGSPASPVARRIGTSRWRDPRLWVGVLLVLAGMAGGAKVLAGADDTTTVWAAAHDIHAGAAVTSTDLVRTDVGFTEASTQARYLPGTTAIPAEARAVRDIAAGELLSRGVLSGNARHARQLPLAVGTQGLPTGLAVGDRVAVWAVPDPTRQEERAVPKRVLREVLVVAVSGAAGAAARGGGLHGDRQVLVRLPRKAQVVDVLQALGGSSVVLVRLGR